MVLSQRDKFATRLVIAALAMSIQLSASAGMVAGPYVVWVNLSKNPQPVNSRMTRYLNSRESQDLCWDSSAIMYMRHKPAGITDDLVRKALLEKDRQAMRALSKILKQPFEEATEGLDGVIVYDDNKGPKYYGFATGKRKVEVYNMRDLTDLEEGICVVIPPVTRKP